MIQQWKGSEASFSLKCAGILPTYKVAQRKESNALVHCQRYRVAVETSTHNPIALAVI